METARNRLLSAYTADPSGSTWMNDFARACRTRDSAVPLPASMGTLISQPKSQYKANPSREFLRWLVENPEVIVRHTPTEKQNRAMATQQKRERLFAGCESTRALALAAVKKFSASLRGEWWRFEGPIEFDFVLLTDSTVLAIDVADAERTWPENPRYPQRHHFLRSLDCAMAFAKKTDRQNFFVAHVVDSSISPEAHTTFIESVLQDVEIQAASLPQLSDEDRRTLIGHFLGAATIEQAFSKRSATERLAS